MNSELHDSVTFVELLFVAERPRTFAVRFWNGFILPPSPGAKAQFTIVLKHPGALRRMFSMASELSLGEAYIYDDCDVEGDIEAAVRVFRRLVGKPHSTRERLRLAALLARLPAGGPPRERRLPRLKGKLHSRDRDSSAIRYHYDVSNDFYQLFLDARMNYSEAYFVRPEEDLDRAQEHKLDRVCHLLELHAGERLLDVGCGWGGLILHAVHKSGVEAVGITLSERQADFARRRIRGAGLESRCRVEVRDYRDLGPAASFDKIASLGMVEHVGAQQLPEYFSSIFRTLRPGGMFLNNGIARPITGPAHRKDSFTDAYVFPDGDLETIPETLQAAEEAGFEVRSVFNRPEDYGRTLRHWVRRLEAHAEEARHATDEVTYRIWRLYMAGSAGRFMAGELHLLDALLQKPRPC